MDEEVSLRELIETLLKGKWIIIAITIVAILISGGVSFYLMEPIYEAKAVVAVNEPMDVTPQSGGLEGLVDSYSSVPKINAQTYASQAKTATVIKKVMERLMINTNEVPITAFSKKINITNIKDTELLEITVKDQDPRKAAEMANALAEELENFITVTNQEKTARTLAFLEKQVNDEQLKLDSSVEEMKQFLKQPESVAELEAELETSLTLLSSFQTRKAELGVETEMMAATIKALEQQLVEIPAKIELANNLIDNPALYQAYAEKKGTELTEISGLELKSEELNPVYTKVKKELELNRALLAQLMAEKTSVEVQRAIISDNIQNIQVNLADKKSGLEQLELNLETVKQNYALFNKKYIESKVTESMKIGEATLMIVSPAHQPAAPVGPKKMLNMAVAGCLGLMLGVFGVLLRGYWVKTGIKL